MYFPFSCLLPPLIPNLFSSSLSPAASFSPPTFHFSLQIWSVPTSINIIL